MNTLYLMKDEKRHFCLFKVGFTANHNQRLYAYTTANPYAECISTVHTQERSERSLIPSIAKKKTEWFKF